jgi:hypothetical protein
MPIRPAAACEGPFLMDSSGGAEPPVPFVCVDHAREHGDSTLLRAMRDETGGRSRAPTRTREPAISDDARPSVHPPLEGSLLCDTMCFSLLCA